MTIPANLSFLAPGASSAGVLSVGKGGTGTSTTFTQNSVIFAGASGVYSQDNAAFSWNDSTNALQIGGTISATGNISSTGGTVADATAVIRPLVSDTSKSLTGTAVDFTSIPSWVKRITLSVSGMSTSASTPPLVQLGTSGGVVTTGYLGPSTTFTSGSAVTVTAFTTGLSLGSTVIAANSYYGIITIANITGNTWVMTATLGSNATQIIVSSSSIALSGTLTTVRIGTATLDAGTANILYE